MWEHVWKKDDGKSNLKVKDMLFTTEFAKAPCGRAENTGTK